MAVGQDEITSLRSISNQFYNRHGVISTDKIVMSMERDGIRYGTNVILDAIITLYVQAPPAIEHYCWAGFISWDVGNNNITFRNYRGTNDELVKSIQFIDNNTKIEITLKEVSNWLIYYKFLYGAKYDN